MAQQECVELTASLANMLVKENEISAQFNSVQRLRYKEEMRGQWQKIQILDLLNDPKYYSVEGSRQFIKDATDIFFYENQVSYEPLYRFIRNLRYWHSVMKKDVREYVLWASDIFTRMQKWERPGEKEIIAMSLFSVVYDDHATTFKDHYCLYKILLQLATYFRNELGNTINSKKLIELRTQLPPMKAYAVKFHDLYKKEEGYDPDVEDAFDVLDHCTEEEKYKGRVKQTSENTAYISLVGRVARLELEKKEEEEEAERVAAAIARREKAASRLEKIKTSVRGRRSLKK